MLASATRPHPAAAARPGAWGARRAPRGGVAVRPARHAVAAAAAPPTPTPGEQAADAVRKFAAKHRLKQR